MQPYVDIQTASFLTGESDRRIRERVEAGVYHAEKRKGNLGGGSGGESYLIQVSSLPKIAQILYMQRNGVIPGPVSDDCQLAAYHTKYGEDGIAELMTRQRAVQNALATRCNGGAGVTAQLAALAQDYDITQRTLYRWMDRYEAEGLPGIMRPLARKDKGKWESLCPGAYQIAYGLYADQVKRTHATIYRKLCEKAAEMGEDACRRCAFNVDSLSRQAIVLEGKADQYPPCEDDVKRGLRIPTCRQTLSRILAAIPADEQTISRRGTAAWKNDHMVMATREKPLEVNRVWFGDHHQFDCFVLDDKGKAIRPWYTVWYDAATGCTVGAVLSTNPNTETITEAFIRAVAHTKHSPFFGLPAALYIDNGKDYRSKTFEMGIPGEYDLGKLNTSIASSSVIQLFNIQVHHAVAYHAWSKTVERWFGTIESIWLREVPGWCGGKAEERPEDFWKDLRRLQARGELWTMDQLHDYLQNTVLPEYHNRPHEGHGDKAPLELYSTLPRMRDDQPSWAMLSVARLNMERRKVHQVGIKFKNRLYWDDALIGMAGEYVTIRYSNSDLSSVSVMYQDRWLCEAGVKETIALIGADEVQLEAHMSKQKRQLRDVRERVKRASRNVFSDDVDSGRAAGNITSLEYEKAARAKQQVKQEQQEAAAAAAAPEKDANDPFRRKLRAMGDELIRQG